MKHGLVLAALALALAGCAVPVAGVASPVPADLEISSAASAGATTPAMSARDMIMVRVIRAGTSNGITWIDDARLVGIAQYVCSLVGADASRNGVQTAILNVSMANGVGLPDAGFVVGAAVANKCPQHTGLIGS